MNNQEYYDNLKKLREIFEDDTITYLPVSLENPQLIDKTNREGLIENGRALDDFINVIQLILQYRF